MIKKMSIVLVYILAFLPFVVGGGLIDRVIGVDLGFINLLLIYLIVYISIVIYGCIVTGFGNIDMDKLKDKGQGPNAY